MSLRQVDLNLLLLLRELLDTASITRSGERLDMSQPAASRAVARLRKALGDPLLVRTARGYVLTPRALALREDMQEALAASARVFELERFTPSTSTRTLRLASTDYGLLVVLGGAVARMRELAPRLRLVVEPWSGETFDALERGPVDLALYADDPLPADFHARDLFREGYAALLRAGHPLLGTHAGASLPRGRALLRQLARYPQIVARYPMGRRHVADDVLERLGLASHLVSVELPYFLGAPSLLMDCDHVMVLPRRAARHLARENPRLASLELGGLRQAFTYRMIWHERVHRDPAVQWLRQRMLEAVSEDRISPAVRSAAADRPRAASR